MSSLTLFIIFVCIIAVLFLVINLVFAPHNPYQEKYSIFECGFHSFLGQNRTQFGVKFFIFALKNLLIGISIVFIVSLLKSSGIVPLIISKLFFYLPAEYLTPIEYFISGILVLI